jgi:hypothetical protein
MQRILVQEEWRFTSIQHELRQAGIVGSECYYGASFLPYELEDWERLLIVSFDPVNLDIHYLLPTEAEVQVIVEYFANKHNEVEVC